MKAIPVTLCIGCGKYFASTTEFDAHRTGRFGIDRRCMSTAEMLAGGWQGVDRLVMDRAAGEQPVQRTVWCRASRLQGAAELRRRAPKPDSR